MKENSMNRNSLRLICWNIEHNGIDHDGSRNRRELALDIMAAYRPHIVLRQELTGADAHGAAALYQEGERLGGLIPFMAPPTMESPNATGVMIDPDVFELGACHPHITNMWHPICNLVVRVRGTHKDLSLASVHLCSYDGQTRATEAKRLTVLGDRGRTALFGGDFNSYPHRTGDELAKLPDWSTITDPVHYEHRTVERAGSRISDTVPDEILAGGNQIFTDLGHHAATKLGQRRAVAATAHIGRTELGLLQRIDRIYCSPVLAPALTSFDVIDSDAVRAVSDHALLYATFDLATFRAALDTD
jgi:endonuclease/exonuclease/phosphatase family metal-dependent hydrolase